MRSLFLHLLGYLGEEEEAKDVSHFYTDYVARGWLEGLGTSAKTPLIANSVETKDRVRKHLTPESIVARLRYRPKDAKPKPPPVTEMARIVHRLSLLGVVREYTVEYHSTESSDYALVTDTLNEVQVLHNLRSYVERYDRVNAWQDVEADYAAANGTFVEKAILALSKFIYRAIERRRREAIWNVRDVLTRSKNGEDLKRELSAYFNTATFGPQLGGLSGDIPRDDVIRSIVRSIESGEDAQQLLGQTRRALESDPNNPSLRVISGLARACIDNPDPTESAESFILGFGEASDHAAALPTEFICTVLTELFALAPEQFDAIVAEALSLAARTAPGIVDHIAIVALPRLTSTRTRQTCARQIAQQLVDSVRVGPEAGRTNIDAVLRSWSEQEGSLQDSDIRDVLAALGPRNGVDLPNSITQRLFAEHVYRHIRDDDLKRACATPILHHLHRSVQQVL